MHKVGTRTHSRMTMYGNGAQRISYSNRATSSGTQSEELSEQTSPTTEENIIMPTRTKADSKTKKAHKKRNKKKTDAQLELEAKERVHGQIVNHLGEAWNKVKDGEVTEFAPITEQLPVDFVPIDIGEYYKRQLIADMGLPIELVRSS